MLTFPDSAFTYDFKEFRLNLMLMFKTFVSYKNCNLLR